MNTFWSVIKKVMLRIIKSIVNFLSNNKIKIWIIRFDLVDEVYEAIPDETITGLAYHDPILAIASHTGKL